MNLEEENCRARRVLKPKSRPCGGLEAGGRVTGGHCRSIQAFEGFMVQVSELLKMKDPGQSVLKKIKPRGDLRVDHEHKERRHNSIHSLIHSINI